METQFHSRLLQNKTMKEVDVSERTCCALHIKKQQMRTIFRESFVSETTQNTPGTSHVTSCVEALFINLKGFRACARELIHS